MLPIEWLSNDPALLRACSEDGFPFSPVNAFRALDGTPHYERAVPALGHSEPPADPVALADIRLWLLKQPGAYATSGDLAPIEPLAA